MGDEGEWRTVTKKDKKRIVKSGKRFTKNNLRFPSYVQNHDEPSFSSSELSQLIKIYHEELGRSQFFEKLQTSLEHAPIASSIVCYGIGNFGIRRSSPSAALWQLVCALRLREGVAATQHKVEIYYFEPFMTLEEERFLKTKSIHIISQNEKARRLVHKPTLFFMPHCPLSLYSNLLFTNLENPANILIFGNSLSDYANRLQQNQHTRLLSCLQKSWKEHVLDTTKQDIALMSGDFEQAFNSSSLTFFEEGSSILLPPDLRTQFNNHNEDDEAV